MSRIVVTSAPSQPSPVGPAAEILRAWFAPRASAYAWRRTRDPYAIWVSEVMLQQTQAPRVEPLFEAFLRRFPTVAALAAAPRSEVLRAWEGLGYNRRAVALSRAARAVVLDHGGRIPSDPSALQRLPGIGPYTSAAVASIAFGVPVAAVDTNIRRVVARVRFGAEAHEVSASEIGGAAGAWIDREDPGTWNQAVMDLGREVCRPRPHCDVCPLSRVCRYRARGVVPSNGPRRQGPFEGSTRQVRGAIVRELRAHPSRSLSSLARDTGFSFERVRDAAAALIADGVLDAGPAALEGRPSGRVRLAA